MAIRKHGLTTGTSPSSRRAWIEIAPGFFWASYRSVALLAEGVDRNYIKEVGQDGRPLSPSSRRAWIEIPLSIMASANMQVALLAEGVDRNCAGMVSTSLLRGRPPRGGRG